MHLKSAIAFLCVGRGDLIGWNRLSNNVNRVHCYKTGFGPVEWIPSANLVKYQLLLDVIDDPKSTPDQWALLMPNAGKRPANMRRFGLYMKNMRRRKN